MNQIQTSMNLAITGAEPMFKQPLYVGRPNIGNKDHFLELVNQILNRQWLTNNGPLVQQLEQRIAEHLGVAHCVAMCNGTIALEIAIRALGLGGEVIVPSWTFVATAHALHWQGITPVFADIDPATHNLDPDAVRRMITPRTTGIVGVHLWGRAAPVDELQAIADEHGLELMFDAAHAFGSSYRGRGIGSFGTCEVFSFHATKAFNTMEGGAVTTNDEALAEAMRLMRNFGFKGYDNVIHPGTNGKMAEINAAMGLVNLEALPRFVATNKRNYEMYAHALKGVEGIDLLEHHEENTSNYQYVILQVRDSCNRSRNEIIEALHAENVLARKYFWPGCHKMRPYRDLYPHAGLVLPGTEMIAGRTIVLPTGGAVDKPTIEAIALIIRRCLAR